VVTYLLEKVFLLQHESRKVVDYEKIDLIVPERREELILDLEERTGIKISRVEVGRIDFLRDSARVYIYYYESDNVVIFSDSDQRTEDDNDDDD
jgi:hypothetical protein